MKEKCEECGGELKNISNETYCTNCGLVIDDTPIDHGRVDNDPEHMLSPTVTALDPYIGSWFDGYKNE